jgi:hypothetical protein
VPTLIIDNLGVRRGIVLRDRILIGRRSTCGVAVDHPDVSRIHAWIGRRENGFYVADAHSRTGTRRNGRPVIEPQPLAEGDTIEIGPAIARFSDAAELPPDVRRLEVSDLGTAAGAAIAGILFACHCGAPMWVSEKLAGVVGHCDFCKSPLRVPGGAGGSAAHPVEPTPQPQAPEPESCSVCQGPIGHDDLTTHCPACGLIFHSECWQENRGCSAYGCSQVNVLDPEYLPPVAPEAAAAELDAAIPLPSPTAAAPFPWEFVILIGSVIGSLIGALTFGVPALLVGIAAVLYGIKHPGDKAHRGVMIISTVACIVGVLIGVLLSRFWWFNDPIPGLGWGRR